MEINSEAGLKISVRPGGAALRRAVRGNMVSFPSQIPILLKHRPTEAQWRMVLLFFVRGWSSARIGARFHVPKHQIQKNLNEWAARALALGIVQIIDPEAFTECCKVAVEYGISHGTSEIRVTEAAPAMVWVSEYQPDEEHVGDA